MIKGGICRPRRIQKGLTGLTGGGLAPGDVSAGYFSRDYQGVPAARHDRCENAKEKVQDGLWCQRPMHID
ncbi:hypothetical protein M6B38_395610 [Iris pallida]|nr:hypothetical protein M6B38_245010 [Iris pallida]KAJ6820831.1 hypothetical protein M6B38_395605 [Iris pallida]KAJ6820832.1 hypothetical protein M6B38_395610 [Iris pallida]